jgi:Fe2+ or Zn2+ uptake regulation protein
MLRRGRFQECLTQAGFRVTRQRRAVYESLIDSDRHPTAEQVFAAVKDREPRISLATVYKSLDSLVAAGLVQKYITEGSARYEARCDEHYHAHCELCGFVIDINPRPEVQRLLVEVAPDGFRAERTLIELRGVCHECAERKRA